LIKYKNPGIQRKNIPKSKKKMPINKESQNEMHMWHPLNFATSGNFKLR